MASDLWVGVLVHHNALSWLCSSEKADDAEDFTPESGRSHNVKKEVDGMVAETEDQDDGFNQGSDWTLVNELLHGELDDVEDGER